MHIIGIIVLCVLVLILYCNYFLTEEKREPIANLHPDSDETKTNGMYRDYEDGIEDNLNLDKYGWAKYGVSWYGWGPWWNSMRHTRNMSYDLRGDIPPYQYNNGPWWNSELI